MLRWKYNLLPFLCTLIYEIRRFFEVYHLSEFVGDEGCKIDKICRKISDDIVHIDTDLINESILDEFLAEGDGEVED